MREYHGSEGGTYDAADDNRHCCRSDREIPVPRTGTFRDKGGRIREGPTEAQSGGKSQHGKGEYAVGRDSSQREKRE
jgi:hypothetical protein